MDLFVGAALGFVFYSGLGCVKYETTKKNYADANAVCKGYGAHLLNVHPEDGHAHIRDFMASIGEILSILFGEMQIKNFQINAMLALHLFPAIQFLLTIFLFK